MPPPGLTAAENMASENEGYSGLSVSVESAYEVGSIVVNELVKGWSAYRDHPPGSASPSAP
jgi:purine nucleoside permease